MRLVACLRTDFDMEIQHSQLKINHLSDTPSTKAAGGGIFSGVFNQGRPGTIQGQKDFELSCYLFFQQNPLLFFVQNDPAIMIPSLLLPCDFELSAIMMATHANLLMLPV